MLSIKSRFIFEARTKSTKTENLLAKIVWNHTSHSEIIKNGCDKNKQFK